LKKAVPVAFLCAVVLAIAAPPHGSFAAGFSGSGSGTAGDPYIITTIEQLQEMRNNLTAHYALGNDIDASGTVNWNDGKGFRPVGAYANEFTGSLDGRGYKIYNLYINRSDMDYVGLFGSVGSEGVVKNVGLINVKVVGGSNVGGLVGFNNGTLSNCYSTGPVSGNGDMGGLVGYNESGTVSNSFWDAQTSGQATSDGGAGKTTENMKNVRTYTDVAWSEGLSSAWDFVGNPYDDAGNEDIWDIDPDVNDGYPFLAELAAPTVTPTTTTTSPTTTTPPVAEGAPWVWAGVGIAIVVIIAVVALVLRGKGK